MKRATAISLCGVSVALIVACNRHDDQAGTSKKSIIDLATHTPALVVPTPVVVTGCLMGAGTEFIIATPDKSKEGSNIVYELTNAGDQLIVLVGQKVRVTGEAEPVQIAEVRELTPVAPATAATSGKAPAKVATVEDTKLHLQRMTVTSVAGTGDSCTPASPR
jgi:hypothetical protein